MNHEAWAIPYGDLITLLLAFFVVMYAISSVNEGKYRVLSDSLFAAFRGTPRTMQPIQVGEKQVGSGADVKTTLVEQAMIEGQPRSMLTPVPVRDRPAAARLTRATAAAATANQQQRASALTKVADEVARAMDRPRRRPTWWSCAAPTSGSKWRSAPTSCFRARARSWSRGAVGVIERLGEALAPFPNAIRVEGHTDNRPIKTVAFISNWELSAARAGSVVRVLASRGIDRHALAVIGYGEYRPAQSNDTAEGRNANRRVVIVILSPDTPASEDPAAIRSPVDTEEPVTKPPDGSAPAPAQQTQASPPGDEYPVTPSAAAVTPGVLTSSHGMVSAPSMTYIEAPSTN